MMRQKSASAKGIAPLANTSHPAPATEAGQVWTQTFTPAGAGKRFRNARGTNVSRNNMRVYDPVIKHISFHIGV